MFSLASTLGVWVSYFVNTGNYLYSFLLLVLVLIINLLTLYLTRYLERDSLSDIKTIQNIDLRNSYFHLIFLLLPLYIQDINTMAIYYVLVLIHSLVTRHNYFNLVFLMFGYKFYKIKTVNNTNCILIIKGDLIRNINNYSFSTLRRINDNVYIG